MLNTEQIPIEGQDLTAKKACDLGIPNATWVLVGTEDGRVIFLSYEAGRVERKPASSDDEQFATISFQMRHSRRDCYWCPDPLGGSTGCLCMSYEELKKELKARDEPVPEFKCPRCPSD